MFASIALAARIDAAETRLSASFGRAAIAATPEAGAFVDEVCGGVAVYAGPSSPINKMIGVGFDGLPSDERLLEIERRFHQHGAPVQAEVATLADPAFAARLTKRGYVLQNFENVSGRPLGGDDMEPGTVGSIEVDLMRDEQAEAWLHAAIEGFRYVDEKGVPAEALPPREVLEASMRPFLFVPSFCRYCAYIDGQLAGVATLRNDDGIAQLCGAATLPPFRRRGVQAALLRRRLSDSVKNGCDLAVLTTQPGSTSQENGHRQGFSLLYSRAVLVKTL